MRLTPLIIRMADIRREAGNTTRHTEKELLPPLPAATIEPQSDTEPDLCELLEAL